jgi:phosphoadenosine phosphosulfate reductase
MINYICENCDNLICETSICPVCHGRTKLNKSEIYWCEHCKAPSFDSICGGCGNSCNYIGSDIRPVFPEERLLIEILLDRPMQYAECSVWNTSGNNYVVDGQKLKVSYNELINKNNVSEIISKLQQYAEENKKYADNYIRSSGVKSFININKIRLNSITNEAIDYVKNITNDRNIDDMFISFSGGKDSTVTSHLVLTALQTNKIIHIYGDTTLEYPETGDYVKRFRNSHKETPLLIARNNDQDFNNLCELIGPPSRVLRWCCTIFKTGAITKKIESTFKDKKQIITFYGIRRSESISRNKYDRESNSPKISKQKVVSPIIDWIDFDIWLYILSNGIDFNYAYRQGFSRVGCWCCPNNSTWSGFLASIYMDQQNEKFKEILYKFAQTAGKPDWKEYIDSGKWKARQGGNGLEYSKNAVVAFKPWVLKDQN